MENDYMHVNYETKGKDLYNFIINHMTYAEVMNLYFRLNAHVKCAPYNEERCLKDESCWELYDE